jgi:hypothetical protein
MVYLASLVEVSASLSALTEITSFTRDNRITTDSVITLASIFLFVVVVIITPTREIRQTDAETGFDTIIRPI